MQRILFLIITICCTILTSFAKGILISYKIIIIINPQLNFIVCKHIKSPLYLYNNTTERIHLIFN